MSDPYDQNPHSPPSDSGGFPHPYQGSYGGAGYPGYQPGQPYPQYQQHPQYQQYPPAQPGGPVYLTAQPPRNNGMAITSMVLSLSSILLTCMWGLGLIPAILGVVFGHVAKKQIRRDGTEGDGMATAGLAVGYCVLGLVLLAIVPLILLGIATMPLIATNA
ncbi:hypothetical protein J2S53_000047 [Actinopolyspora lacussalsi]|nr:hypothetical protein [Actinopolyspora lacussalsi]